MNKSGVCWSCGQTLAAADFGRENRCPACQKATHACRNCLYYQPGLNNDCREPVAEYIVDKQGANFCDYFEPNPTAHAAGQETDTEAQRSAAEDLFKL